jgi:hypothetical protein
MPVYILWTPDSATDERRTFSVDGFVVPTDDWMVCIRLFIVRTWPKLLEEADTAAQGLTLWQGLVGECSLPPLHEN